MDALTQPLKESSVSLLRGSVSFTTEPLWYRLVVVFMMGAFLLGMIWVLKEWAIPALAAKGLSGFGVRDLFKFSKGKLP